MHGKAQAREKWRIKANSLRLSTVNWQMSDEKHKSREKIRNIAVAVMAAIAFVLGIFNFVDNRQAKRDAQRPYLGLDEVTVSRPNLTLPPGTTKVFTCVPNITTPNEYAQLEDPRQTRTIELTKPIDFKLRVVYEDMFHRIETKDFCFSNQPDWDHTHLRSCEE